MEGRQYKILVVDDEVVLSKIISTRLRKLGYETFTVSSGFEALNFLKATPPDLIILDLLMPGMDGYEVTQEIRQQPATANIPIIMLTAKVSQETKIKALKLGIDDFMTKPYDAEELAARIEAVLRRAGRAASLADNASPTATAPAVSLQDKKRIEFLKKMIAENVFVIIPEYNMQVRTGYYYRSAAQFFEKSNGFEIDDLNYLVERGALEQRFHDKILVCPFCHHHNINIREVCPYDKSADIALMPTIHHYKCGYVGLESDFMQGIRYYCPKCQDELRSIGVDYDKPGKMYYCRTDHEKFHDPHILCQCRNCKREFPSGDALRQNIFGYVLTDKARTAVDQGRFFTVNFEDELMDQDINLFNLNYFRQKFREELIRAKEFNRPLSLIMIEIRGMDLIIVEKGESVAQNILKDLTGVLKRNLKQVDIPARYDKFTFVCLLPEADDTKVSEVRSVILSETGHIDPILNIDVRTASYPEDGDNRDDLLDVLVSGKKLRDTPDAGR